MIPYPLENKICVNNIPPIKEDLSLFHNMYLEIIQHISRDLNADLPDLKSVALP